MPYLPGLRDLIVLLVIVVLALLALTVSPQLPLLALSILLAYMVYTRREWILELYGERVLLLHPVMVEFVEVKFRRDHAVIRQGKKTLYAASLRVNDYDPPQNLGRAAERFIASLHNPSARVTLVARLREGGYEYYALLASEDKHVLREAIASTHRQLLANGVYVQAADPAEVLPHESRLFGLCAPRFTLLASGILVAVALAHTPLLALAAIPLLPLIPYELKIARGGETVVVEPLVELEYRSTLADEAAAASAVRVVSTLSMTVPEGAMLLASLAPADIALLEAQARRAMEVLDAARAGVGRLAHEFKAMRIFTLWRRLQEGAAPFHVSLAATPDLARELMKAGFTPKHRSRISTLRVLGVLPSYSDIYISHQLAPLSPYAFLRPRTRRTPKAIYLGHGLRRDEEVWLELDALENVHGLIIGPMGSGKSTTARTLALRALKRGYVPIIVDPSGEYRLWAYRVGFEVVDLWDKQIDISRVSPDDLRRAFDYISPLTDYEFLVLKRALEAGKSLWELNIGKLELIKPYFSQPTIRVEDLLDSGKPFILCLGSTSSGRYVPIPVEYQRFAVSVMLAMMRDHVIAKGVQEPKWLLIVDEAHLFSRPPLREREAEVVTLARMLRKFGLAVILITHDWRDVDETYIRHCGWKLALSHSSPEYVQDTAFYMSLTPSELTWFQRGLRGRAVLRRGFEPHNVMLEIEPEEYAKPEVYSQLA
jgi:nucleoside-triphosphatase THEP1